MKTIVVGGHARNIGKTSVMASLIRSLSRLNWTAVKVTQHGHGVCSLDGRRCECEPGEHAFALTEEKNPAGRADTCRYLAAGAGRSLWLRVRQNELAQAYPALQSALGQAEYVIIESNSILEFLKPDLYLAVMDSTVQDFKASALRYLDQADALVPAGSRVAWRAFPALNGRGPKACPVFPVRRPAYSSPELFDFVRQKLGLPAAVDGL